MMRPSIDHYQLLGLARDVDLDRIHRAYRALARSYHPDVNPGPRAAAQMARLNQAYACLADPARRRQYDESLRVPEPLPLQRAVLDAAEEMLTRSGWRRLEIGRDDWILEAKAFRVFVRFVPILGSVELESWLRGLRGALRRDLAGSGVVVACRVLVPDQLPEVGSRVVATAIDLIEGRAIGGAFIDSCVEQRFKPLLSD